MRPLILCLCGLLAAFAGAQEPVIDLEPEGWVPVEVPEPSDLAALPGRGAARFAVVSDNGHVAIIHGDGTVDRKVDDVAFDLEGACYHDGELVVVDERSRRVIWLDTATLAVRCTLTVPYSGARREVGNPAVRREFGERAAFFRARPFPFRGSDGLDAIHLRHGVLSRARLLHLQNARAAMKAARREADGRTDRNTDLIGPCPNPSWPVATSTPNDMYFA